MTRPFVAIIPQTVKGGDKIRLKGKIKTGGYEYSINFANESCPYPGNVFYHFKVIIPEKLIVENHKKNNEWMEEQVKDWEIADGRLMNFSMNTKINNCDLYTPANAVGYDLSMSFLGSEFALEFIFREEGVYVYLFDEDSRNYVSYYENQQSDLSEIQSVQVWGDVEKVNELTFQYS